MSATTMTHPIVSTKTTTTTSTANSSQFLEVIDPVNRTGKITIPMQYVQETRGMNELTRPKDAKDLSLCLLFQKGRCNASSRCHQIHADPVFVNKLRTQASTGSSCCALHGDFNSASYVTAGLTVEVMTNGVPSAKYSLQAFGRTQTMDQMMSYGNKAIRMNANKICRLHAQSRCKFGKDCKNVHMCPNAKPLTQTQTQAQTQAPAPLSGFTRPTETAAYKSAGPLGASASTSSMGPTLGGLNTANRKMKYAPALGSLESGSHSWAGRSDFTNSDSLCSTGGLTASCPSTPNPDMCGVSTRSLSVESGTSTPSTTSSNTTTQNLNGLSPALSLSPGESPKEKPFPAAAASHSLFNRNMASASPAPISESPVSSPTVTVAVIPTTTTTTETSSFASETDAVFTRATRQTIRQPTTLTASALAPAAQASIWGMQGLKTQAGGNPSPLASTQAFEHTMSQLAMELSGLTCSPSWSVNQ